jgi:hypothetical protein
MAHGLLFDERRNVGVRRAMQNHDDTRARRRVVSGERTAPAAAEVRMIFPVGLKAIRAEAP